MKTNRELGYARIATVGNYNVGRKGNSFRAYGYEWDYCQDIRDEQSHHEVCGRGITAEAAIDAMCSAAIISGRTQETVYNMRVVNGLTPDEARKLAAKLKEAVAEASELA